jgi:hypothetical protein
VGTLPYIVVVTRALTRADIALHALHFHIESIAALAQHLTQFCGELREALVATTEAK